MYQKTLNLKTLVCLYQRLLDCPKITYTNALIISSDFEDINFLVLLKIGGIGNNEETMIFVDSVKKDIILKKYLQSLLQNNLKNKDKKIIIFFLSILKAKIKTNYLKNFLNNNTRIFICTNITIIRVNNSDIKYVIQ